MDPDEIVNELAVVREDFRTLLDGATSADLRAAPKERRLHDTAQTSSTTPRSTTCTTATS